MSYINYKKEELKKICIIIPTQNRAKSIECYLEAMAGSFYNKGVYVIIYDSSTDDSTKHIVYKYIEQGFSNIEYARYKGETEPKAIDMKVFTACKKYCSEYSYLWLTSDRTIVNIDTLWDNINKYCSHGYDLIVYDNRDYMGITLKEYTDCTKLFHDCCWRMTCLSAVLVSSRILTKCVENYPIIYLGSSQLWLPMTYFRVIANEPFKAIYFIKPDSWKANPCMSDAFWASSGNILWQWGKVWCESVNELPSIYNNEKDFVIYSHDKYLRLFSIRSIISMRASGNITLEKVKEHSKYIPKITKTRMVWFYIVGIVISKRLIGIIRNIYHRLHNL